MTTSVRFEYHVGLFESPFRAATLVGSWDDDGRPSADWSSKSMTPQAGSDGDVFVADVALRPAPEDQGYRWGVQLIRKDGPTVWGIMSEVPELGRGAQERSFVLPAGDADPPLQTYHLSRHRGLGARPDGDRLAFSVWAPNATAVDVVFGGPSGYIADDGSGADSDTPPVSLSPGAGGLWTGTIDGFADVVGRGYMYRVTRDDGQTGFHTDMYSLLQAGGGDVDPGGKPYDGAPADLDGSPSCSVIVDTATGGAWDDEHDPERPVPRALSDLIIYELHVGALGPGSQAAGTLDDAMALLPYLEDLGVNAIELLPLFEFNGTRSWGYGSTHFLAIETSAGGRDALKAFVKACHRRGIAVLMDVVYNHYDGDAARSAWQYDSARPSRNIYYWYEGNEDRYPTADGGYVDNVSSGWAPRYLEEQVRALFVSSAAMLVDEFHIDGFRVDQTTSIHAYNRLHADGSEVPAANIFGRKLLRELCQTLQTIRPTVMLVAEDHSGWDRVTQPAATGGMGFDAAWYVDFYHHLVGDKGEGPEYARLLYAAARHDGPLAMGRFAEALAASAGRTVVYPESHDEAGNASESRRTIRVAVDGAPLVGPTRRVAEARTRFAAAMSLLSPGTPMFLMGEEAGAEKQYTYDRFYENKEDLLGLRRGSGKRLFRFHQDLIGLRLSNESIRSRNIEIVHAHDANRTLAFRRWDGDGEQLVVASLAVRAYDAPDYRLTHPSLSGKAWHEVLNSDERAYGGDGVGNGAAPLHASGGTLGVVIPASGVVVLDRIS